VKKENPVLSSIRDLFEDHLKDLYNAEMHLTKALPRMAKAANSPSLARAFTDHLAETKTHVERLEKIAQVLEFKPTGKKCHGMEGLIEEGKEAMEEEGEDAAIDAALVAAAQKVEHYEISAYGTARALAEKLGDRTVLRLLDETLNEEKAADKKLTSISTDELLPAMPVEDAG
jgi:ferritin-like metal-binding protein YciE